MSDVSRSLADTALEITAIASPIGEEKVLCDHVEARLARTLGAGAMTRFRDSLIVRVAAGVGPHIALVGHLDTVRTSHDGPARIEGDRLYGAGAADMKSGLAVMIELAERLDLSSLACTLTMVFYEREEGPFDENVLGPMFEEFEVLTSFDLAICLEPSNNELQLGCMGSVHAWLHFHGKTAHSARPWQGDNAILKAWPLLQRLAEREPHDVELDGHHFREVISPTLANADRARNVIPDVFDVNVNYRFAPPRTPQEVVKELEALVGDAAEVEPTDLSPAGRPHATHPLVTHLANCGVTAVKTKQAWTDVARFDAAGVPAVNFGPGTQNQAHQRNEWTELPLLRDGYDILHRFLTEMPVEP